MDSKPWYRAAWALVDNAMRTWSERLQRILRLLRFARFMLLLGVVVAIGSAVVQFAAPQYFAYAYAAAMAFLVVPLIVFYVLAGLPLRARSVVRLVDMGYPANARELAIRMVARKLHEESIATEELLWDTAVNEGRKFIRKMENEKTRRQAGDPAPGDDDPNRPSV